MVEIICALLLVEAVKRFYGEKGFFADIKADVIEAGLMTIIGAQQLAPSLPYLTQAAGNLAGTLGKVAPLLAAGA